MSSADRVLIEKIYAAAVRRVQAGNALPLSLKRIDARRLDIGGTGIEVSADGVYVIALGKAALGMASAAETVLGDLLTGGMIVTKEETGAVPASMTVLKGSHPVPDERSIDAGSAVLRFARMIPEGATVLCLISGGGSALVEAPRDGVSLATLRDVTRQLLRAGASIHEMNAVRSRLSRIKAGGLLRHLSHTRVFNLIVSDVLGDDLHSIASGPTVAPAHALDPITILERYGVEMQLPADPSALAVDTPHTTIVANISIAIDAAVAEARALGLTPFVLTRSLDGVAREVGRFVGAVLRDTQHGRTSLTSGTCLIAGGETVVTLTGNGVGGRNTEAALAAALSLSGATGCTVGFLATDGDDGISGAAGGIVDGGTVSEADRDRAVAALRNNDSFTYLSDVNATWMTGPSGTNVNDLVIGIVAGP